MTLGELEKSAIAVLFDAEAIATLRPEELNAVLVVVLRLLLRCAHEHPNAVKSPPAVIVPF